VLSGGQRGGGNYVVTIRVGNDVQRGHGRIGKNVVDRRMSRRAPAERICGIIGEPARRGRIDVTDRDQVEISPLDRLQRGVSAQVTPSHATATDQANRQPCHDTAVVVVCARSCERAGGPAME
jgi:hypothetical protein